MISVDVRLVSGAIVKMDVLRIPVPGDFMDLGGAGFCKVTTVIHDNKGALVCVGPPGERFMFSR